MECIHKDFGGFSSAIFAAAGLRKPAQPRLMRAEIHIRRALRNDGAAWL
jgi:hypothetical protein